MVGQSSAVWGQSTAPANPPVIVNSNPRLSNLALRQQTFEMVWETVKQRHFDPTFGGVNWDQVRAQYEPKVATVTSDAAFYELLQQMLGELKQSHFGIIPPEAVVEDDTSQPSNGEVGLTVRLVGAQICLTQVNANSEAARKGLRPGFVLQRINATPVAELLAKLDKVQVMANLKSLRAERLVQARLNGAAGQPVQLTYLDERNQVHEVTLTRTRITGEFSPAFGNFGPQHMEFEAKRLPSGYGYIRFNIFVMPMMEKVRAALREMQDVPGLIFDLRGNPGGLGGMAPGIGGHLFKEQLSLGKMQMRSGYTNFAVFPQPLQYAGRIAILQDGSSASTSELFTSGMQELGRAVIVGERSAGAALPSLIQRLPTGALFQYAIGDFKTPKGTLIEGRGVIPNLEVKLTRAGLLSGRDLPLEAAVAALQRPTRGGRP